MEILVARLDFSLAGCRESGRFSNSPLWEPTPPRSPETSRGETAVRRPSSNTRMRNFVKPCPRRLGRLHKRDGPPSSRRSPRPVIEIDASVPRCWPTPATRQMSRKPTGGHYLTLHRQIFLLRWLTTVQDGGKNPLISSLELKIPKGNSLHSVICLQVCRKLSNLQLDFYFWTSKLEFNNTTAWFHQLFLTEVQTLPLTSLFSTWAPGTLIPVFVLQETGANGTVPFCTTPQYKQEGLCSSCGRWK